MVVDRERCIARRSLSVIARASFPQLSSARQVVLFFGRALPSVPVTALGLAGEALLLLGQSSGQMIPGGSWSASLAGSPPSRSRSSCPSAGSSH